MDVANCTDDREVIECLEKNSACEGAVGFRTSLSGTGRAFPRCDYHWDRRLRQQEEIDRRYPRTQPSDFDPAYAGESWDEV